MWIDFNKMKYLDSAKDVDAQALLDMNDLSKKQLVELTGHLVTSSTLNPIIFKCILKDFVNSFLNTLGKKYFTSNSFS